MSATASLFLHPAIPDWFPEQPEFLNDQLKNMGLIADALDATETQFYAGAKFFDLISFMGCSPAISLDPGNNKSFCRLKLHFNVDTQFIHSLKLVCAPHCPNCKKSSPKWLEQNNSTPWKCPHCWHIAAAWDYNWRHSAGFARIFIEITNIFPKEALPQPVLLSALQDCTHVVWDYFYYCS